MAVTAGGDVTRILGCAHMRSVPPRAISQVQPASSGSYAPSPFPCLPRCITTNTTALTLTRRLYAALARLFHCLPAVQRTRRCRAAFRVDVIMAARRRALYKQRRTRYFLVPIVVTFGVARLATTLLYSGTPLRPPACCSMAAP